MVVRGERLHNTPLPPEQQQKTPILETEVPLQIYDPTI